MLQDKNTSKMKCDLEQLLLLSINAMKLGSCLRWHRVVSSGLAEAMAIFPSRRDANRVRGVHVVKGHAYTHVDLLSTM